MKKTVGYDLPEEEQPNLSKYDTRTRATDYISPE